MKISKYVDEQYSEFERDMLKKAIDTYVADFKKRYIGIALSKEVPKVSEATIKKLMASHVPLETILDLEEGNDRPSKKKRQTALKKEYIEELVRLGCTERRARKVIEEAIRNCNIDINKKH